MDVIIVVVVVCDYLVYSVYLLIGVLWYSMVDKVQVLGNVVFVVFKMKICDFYMECILVCCDVYKVVYKVGFGSIFVILGNEFDYLQVVYFVIVCEIWVMNVKKVIICDFFYYDLNEIISCLLLFGLKMYLKINC